MSSTSCRIFGVMSALEAPENSTSRMASGLPWLIFGDKAVRTVGANAGFCSASSIMVRSTSSTALSVPSSPSVTMCWAESIAL